MKKTLAIAALAIFGSSAFAKATKICFGSTKADETNGVVLLMTVERQQVTLKTLNGDWAEGTWPTYGTTVNGRDGKTYLEYKGEMTDYQEVIMVDEELLHKGSKGLLQSRARGEGFFNSVFVCSDPKPKKKN